MIDSSTEVIFLDEAYSNLLDIDDWKIICQGGFTSHDVKWKKAQGFHCRASMYITCQQEMDFGVEHNDAMNRRFHKYYFSSLPHVETEANQWLREHAMDCIVWAQRMVVAESTTTPSAQVSEDGGLAGDDIQRILSVSLIDENLLAGSSQPECSTESVIQNSQLSSQSEGDDTDDGSNEGDVNKLRREVEKATPGGIRHRQLSMLLENAETRQKATRRFNKTMRNHRLANRRQSLVELGVVDQSEASELIVDPYDPLPPHLERKKETALEEKRKQLEAKKLHEEQKNIREAFENPWLLNMEKDMAEYSRRMEETSDEEERKVMRSLLEINCDKLRTYHVHHGTLKLPAAFEERKRLLLSNQLVEPSCVNLIRDVYSPPPVVLGPASRCLSTPPESSQSAADDEDDDYIFVTPKTPSYVPQFQAEPPCPPSPVMLFTPRKRSRVQSERNSKKQKKLTSFFQSQN